MKRRSFLNLGVLLLSLILLVGCFEKKESPKKEVVAEQSTAYEEVVIQNGDRTLVFKKMPEKVLSTSLYTVENMIMLGLEDKIVGRNVPRNAAEVPLPQFKEKVDKIPTVERTHENVIAMETDFIIGQISAFSEGGTHFWGTFKQFDEKDINAYVISGTIATDETIENVYEDVRVLGKVFKVEAKAEEVIAEMKARISKLQESVKDIKDEDKPKVFVMDAFKGNSIYTTSKGLQSDLIELAGGKNVTRNMAESRWFNTSIETIVDTNPDIIIFNDYGSVSIEDKIKFIDENPALQDVNAVKNKKYYVIPLVMVMQNVRAVDAAEMFSEYFYQK